MEAEGSLPTTDLCAVGAVVYIKKGRKVERLSLRVGYIIIKYVLEKAKLCDYGRQNSVVKGAKVKNRKQKVYILEQKSEVILLVSLLALYCGSKNNKNLRENNGKTESYLYRLAGT